MWRGLSGLLLRGVGCGRGRGYAGEVVAYLVGRVDLFWYGPGDGVALIVFTVFNDEIVLFGVVDSYRDVYGYLTCFNGY